MSTRLPERLATAALAIGILLASCTSAASPTADPSAPMGSPSASAEPTGSPVPTLAPSGAPSAAPSAGPSAATSYTVRAGDTLSSIARAWGTTVAQLQSWNAERYTSLAGDPGSIQAGWVLTVSGDPNATPLPTPVVTPAPANPPPAASGCRAGNRVAAGGAQTFYQVPNAGRAVALTFDMGGRLEPGVDILNFLIANKVCATLFPTGAMAQTPQGRQIMEIVRAHPELFEVGNHTMHHCNLRDGGGGSPTTAPCTGVAPTADFIRQELTTAATVLKDLSGQNPQPYWRPPYGAISPAVINAAAAAGYTKTFMWDIDTIDWKPISDGGPTAQAIATKVITGAKDGSNVLMHLGGYETLNALKLMVPGLRDRGFLLTSLSDLLN